MPHVIGHTIEKAQQERLLAHRSIWAFVQNRTLTCTPPRGWPCQFIPPNAQFRVLTEDPLSLDRRAVEADAQFPRAHIRPGDY